MRKLTVANQKLADLLVLEEFLTPTELQHILVQHSLIGGRLADFLIDTAIVPESSLLQLWERVHGTKIAHFAMLEQLDTEVVRLIPGNLAHLQNIIPFRIEADNLHIAVLEPPDLDSFTNMKGLSGRNLVFFLAPRELLRWAIAKNYPELFLTPANANHLFDPFENRIGHRLISEGLLTVQQLEEALLERTPGKAGRTGELLLRMGYISEDDLFRSLAAQTKIPFVKIPVEFLISQPVAALFSRADAAHWQSIPVFEDETTITILTSEPSVIPELRNVFDRTIVFMLSTPGQIRHLTQQLRSQDDPLTRILYQQNQLRFEQRAKVLEYALENNTDLKTALMQLEFVPLEKILAAMAALPDEQVIPTEEPWEMTFSGRLAHTLAEQLGVRYINPNENPPDWALKNLIPEKIMRQYSLFPYQKTSHGIAVLMTDPRNIFALNDLDAIFEQPIEAVMADRLEIERLIEQATHEPTAENLENMIRRLIREELELFKQQLDLR